MIEFTGYERSVLTWLATAGPTRLMEIVAMLNPPPKSQRVLWFGGRRLDEWKTRTEQVCKAVLLLESDGLVECVRQRWPRISSVYGITDAGRVMLAAVDAAAQEAT